jgi:hypothetical protein
MMTPGTWPPRTATAMASGGASRPAAAISAVIWSGEYKYGAIRR